MTTVNFDYFFTRFTAIVAGSEYVVLVFMLVLCIDCRKIYGTVIMKTRKLVQNMKQGIHS
jgi:hypothetical protein